MEEKKNNLKFTPWQAVYLSFFNKTFYQDVVEQWTGFAYIYLVSLLFIINLVAVTRYTFVWIPQTRQFVLPMVKQMPDIIKKNGQLTINKNLPFKIYLSGTQRIYLLIDPKAQTYNINLNPIIQLTNDNCYFNYPDPMGNDISKKNYVTLRTVCLKLGDNFTLTQKEILEIVNTAFIMIPAVIFMVFYPMSIIICIFQSMFYGIIGYFINLLLDKHLKLEQTTRLAVIAMTPFLVVSSLYRIFVTDPTDYRFILVNTFMTLTYLTYGIVVQQKVDNGLIN